MPQVNHVDGDKSNNHVSNLQWCTNSFNMAHAHANGLRPNYKAIFAAKPTKGKFKLTNDQIIEIRNTRDQTRKQVAEKFNVSLGMVKDIRANKLYSYIQ